MAIKTKPSRITIAESDSIEKAMYDKGYLTDGYVFPAKTIETDVPCPVCGNYLALYVSGNSHRISCKDSTCVNITFRGL